MNNNKKQHIAKYYYNIVTLIEDIELTKLIHLISLTEKDDNKEEEKTNKQNMIFSTLLEGIEIICIADNCYFIGFGFGYARLLFLIFHIPIQGKFFVHKFSPSYEKTDFHIMYIQPPLLLI